MFSSSTTGLIIPNGQVAFTSAGTYSWTVPEDVTSVSVVCVGAGGSSAAANGSGGGGALAYKNDIAVTPGDTYTIIINAPANGSSNGDASFSLSGTQLVLAKGGSVGGANPTAAPGGSAASSIGDVKYSGGYSQWLFGSPTGGGGAAGYSGNGGQGGHHTQGNNGYNGSGGGGAGGAGYTNAWYSGGGVGLLGEGSSGLGGALEGAGGSGAVNPSSAKNGGAYGGGAAAGGYTGGSGAVRIIWSGAFRRFPSTFTGDV